MFTMPLWCEKERLLKMNDTPAQKREVIERLYAAWLKVPQLRLLQLFIKAVAIIYQSDR